MVYYITSINIIKKYAKNRYLHITVDLQRLLTSFSAISLSSLSHSQSVSVGSITALTISWRYKQIIHCEKMVQSLSNHLCCDKIVFLWHPTMHMLLVKFHFLPTSVNFICYWFLHQTPLRRILCINHASSSLLGQKSFPVESASTIAATWMTVAIETLITLSCQWQCSVHTQQLIQLNKMSVLFSSELIQL